MLRLPRLIRLATAGLLALLPTQALAYYPCNGPGPDEVLIGIDKSAGYDVPLCEYVGPPEDQAGGYWVDQYAVLAWGNDANGTPTYTWTVGADSQAAAESGALGECSNRGFLNCRAATWVVNGAIAVTVDNSGSLHSDQGPDAATARKKALRACKSQGGKGCKVEQVLESLPVWVSN
jgi:hypothetical protein